MNAFATWLVARAREPSTWAGLAGLVASMTFLPHADEVAKLIGVVGVAAGSALAVVLPEMKGN